MWHRSDATIAGLCIFCRVFEPSVFVAYEQKKQQVTPPGGETVEQHLVAPI